MKRILTIVVLVAICVTAALGMSACGDPVQGDYKVGIVQSLEHGALDNARIGFQDELTRLMGEVGKTVGFDYKNAQNDQSIATNIVDSFVAKRRDMIFAIGTQAAQVAATKTAERNIPTLFTAVTAPVESNLVESMEKPGKNVTGTTDLVNLDRQLDLLIAVMREVKPTGLKIGFLYTSSETNSQYQVDQMTALIQNRRESNPELDLQEPVAKAINDMSEVAANLNALKTAGVDIVFIPTDNTIAKAVEKVRTDNEASAKLPIVCGDIDMTAGCGVATIGINFMELGKQTAQMAFDVLYNGKNPAEMPVQQLIKYELHTYQDNAAKIGFTVPDLTDFQ